MPAPLFQPLATDFDQTLQAGMADVVSSGLAWAAPQLRTLLVLYVAIYAIGFMLTAHVSLRQLVFAALRGLIVAAAVQAANYNTWVVNLFFTRLPNEIATALGGARTSIDSAEQFDRLWWAVLNVCGHIIGQATRWYDFGDRAMAWLMAYISLGGIGTMFLLWLVPRMFMALVICLGPFLIPLYLFEATRSYVVTWTSKLVGLTVLGLAASILLRVLLVMINTRFQAIQGSLGSSVDEMLGAFAGIAGLMWFGAGFMFFLPSFVAIGAGMGVAQAGVAAFMLTAPGRASVMAGRAAGSLSAAGRRISAGARATAGGASAMRAAMGRAGARRAMAAMTRRP